jgi:LytS/YehU family sensor histidine kinase
MVLISEEMKVIKDYIELEKLRYNERLQLVVAENIQSENRIPPLLFLSLVENAFKHGKAGNTGKIAIFISIETDAVKTVLKVENSCLPKENRDSKGMGLKIIQDQLKIIYGDQSQFKIENKNGFFKVQIQIPANEN